MSSTQRFEFIGGHPAIDFLNTIGWRLTDEPQESITSFADLVAWARRAGLIDADQRRAQEAAASRAPSHAARVLRLALGVRELGYRLVEALLKGKRPREADLKHLNDFIRRRGRQAAVDWTRRGYSWTVSGSTGDLDRLLHLLVKSLTDFLTSPDSRCVAQCQDDRGCGWVFLDRSPGKVRRWCSMADCGNRAKARRHYQRSVGL